MMTHIMISDAQEWNFSETVVFGDAVMIKANIHTSVIIIFIIIKKKCTNSTNLYLVIKVSMIK